MQKYNVHQQVVLIFDKNLIKLRNDHNLHSILCTARSDDFACDVT